MYLHNLNPVAIEIFGLKVYWYSLSYLFGFIFSLFFSKFLIKKKIINLNPHVIDNFFSWAVLGVILGGRLGYTSFYNFEFYLNNPIEVLKIWKGGMSFHGGLIGLIISMYTFSKIYKINFINLSNLVACCAPVGIFFGRIANFINAELIGKPTFSSWGVKYGDEDVLRHPSQLYEAFFEGLVIYIILMYVLKKDIYLKINLSSLFLIFYGLFRFIIAYYREPDSHLGTIFYGLSMGQILSIPLIVFGFLILRYGR